MELLKSIAAKGMATTAAAAASSAWPARLTTKAVGDSGEELALRFLLKNGLHLVARNFKTPGRGGGEVDLIMRASDGTLVFVEVRLRKSTSHGGAAASISMAKKRRIVFAAQHYISRLVRMPPCRFDVIALSGEGDVKEARIDWLVAAFDAS